MSVDALDIAKYILNYFREKTEDSISNLKLQKLLYYAQGWHLALYDEPLFDKEIQAWIHGPVVPDIYHQFKRNSWKPISDDFEVPRLEPRIETLLGNVCETYGYYLPYELERMTHEEKPWVEARGDLMPDAQCTNAIKNETMRSFFKNIAY